MTMQSPIVNIEKKKKILLVNPSSLSKKSILVDLEAIAPPLGLLYIAAILEENHIVQIFDENVSSKNILNAVKDFDPDFIGISANFSFQFPRAIRLAIKIKDYNSGIKIAMGGTHTTYTNPDITLGRYRCIDFLIRGEAEFALLKLVSGEKLHKIEGLSYREDNKIKSNGIAKINDLDKLPFPARHLIDSKSYKIHPFEYSHHRNATLLTSRGCLYNCVNCTDVNKKYRVRSPENVIIEMKQLKRNGIKDLTIYDPCFTLDMERAEKICELMLKEKLKFTWACETRADRINEKLLKKMKKAGCVRIFYGIETASPKIMKFLKKNLDLNQVRKAIDLTKSAKIKTSAGFMIGYPFETKYDFKKMIEFSKSLNIDVAWFNILTPFPGTELWKMTNYDENDLKVLERLSLYSGEITFGDREDIENCLSEAVRSFYLRPKIIFGLLLDLLTKGTLNRKLDLFKLLFFKNPFLRRQQRTQPD